MSTRWWPRTLATLGFLVVGSAGWHYAVLDAPPTLALHDLVTVIMIGGAGFGLLAGAYWFRQTPFSSDRSLRIVGWMGASTLLFVSLGIVILQVGSRTVLRTELVEAVHLAGSIGLAGGLLVGTIHTQALKNAERAARAEAEAAAIEAEQERLREINALLRHYVLNGMQVVIGYADRLHDVTPAEHQPELDLIEERAEAIVTLIEHIRSITKVDDPGDEPMEVDLEAALHEAVTESDPDVAIRIEPSDDELRVVDVHAVDGLSLLGDAMTAVMGAEGTLRIRSEHRDGQAVVTLLATEVDNAPPVAGSGRTGSTAPELKFYLADLLLNKSSALEVIQQTDDRLEFELRMHRAGSTGDALASEDTHGTKFP